MTLKEFKSILDTTLLPVAYQAFPETDAPAMPFICYAEINSDNFKADGKVYEPIKVIEVQLFEASRSTTTEALIESAFDSNRIVWRKEPELLESESCIRVIYTVEV